MDIVEKYLKLNDAIAELENRAFALRQDILRSGSQPRNSQHAVERRQKERVFRPELLPPEILNNPKFWDMAEQEEAGSPAVASHAPVVLDLFRYRC